MFSNSNPSSPQPRRKEPSQHVPMMRMAAAASSPPGQRRRQYGSSALLEGLESALKSLEGPAPQRRRPSMRDVDQSDLEAPATLFLRMALKEGPGTWRPAWVEVRSDGHLSIFCAGAGGGTTSPVPHAGPSSSLFLHLSAHIERLLEFMPVLDEHCKAVCLRLLPATTLYLASSADPHAGAHAGPSEGVLHRLLACLSSHERLYGHCRQQLTVHVKRMLTLSRLPFDAANADHRTLLEQYWRATTGEPLPAPTGPHWQRLGFQGDDPATDFRGMGVLGLHQLLYLATHHPECTPIRTCRNRAHAAAARAAEAPAAAPSAAAAPAAAAPAGAPAAALLVPFPSERSSSAPSLAEAGRSGSGGSGDGGSSFPLAIAGINLSKLLLRLLDVDDGMAAANACDCRWDSPLFLFLCRAMLRLRMRHGSAAGAVPAASAAAPSAALASLDGADAAAEAEAAVAASDTVSSPANPWSSALASSRSSGEVDRPTDLTLRSRLASSESPPRQTMTERSVFGAEHRRPLGEVYSLLLLLIHHIYAATNARSQMDFPAILALAEAKLCHALASADGERRPDTIEQLRDALLPEL